MSGPVQRCVACNTPIRRGQLMCREHWHTVPRKLQREVNRSWRAFKAAAATDKLAALKDYRAAGYAAIAAVEASRP